MTLGRIFLSLLIQFGNVIRAERLKAHISQEQLAEPADVHRTYMGMIERGEKNITITNIQRLSQVLCIFMSIFLKKAGPFKA